jgi:Rrf2 family iron-sulfur cluster assembly transcriptional regulator
VPLLARKSVLAIAAVIDITVHRGRPLSAKALALRYGVPRRHFEPLLQALVRRGILKGIRGAHGGYRLARERSRVLASEIVEAAASAGDQDAPLPAPSHLLATVVMPALGQAEQAFCAALARITLDDLVQRARSVIQTAGGGLAHELKLPNSQRETRRHVTLLAPLGKREGKESRN